jgi:hypothetical protein
MESRISRVDRVILPVITGILPTHFSAHPQIAVVWWPRDCLCVVLPPPAPVSQSSLSVCGVLAIRNVSTIRHDACLEWRRRCLWWQQGLFFYCYSGQLQKQTAIAAATRCSVWDSGGASGASHLFANSLWLKPPPLAINALNGTTAESTTTTPLADVVPTTVPTNGTNIPPTHQIPPSPETATRDSMSDTNSSLLDTANSTNTTWIASTTTTTTLANATTTAPCTETMSHSTNSYVPLAAWEVASTDTDRICRPPAGIPNYCCLGGTTYFAFKPHSCNLGLTVYERNEALALSSLPRLDNAIPTHDVECDACRIIDVLWEYNWTMAFLGDSVTQQSVAAFECELHRRDIYNVQMKDVPFAIIGNGSASDHTWEYGLRQIFELSVSKKSHPKTPSESASPMARIRLYYMYRPKLTDVQDYIAGRHDIVIFDHGLHYPAQAPEFPLDMMNLATLLRTGSSSSSSSSSRGLAATDIVDHVGEIKLLAWRETSAQHFEGSTGDYHDSKDRTRCVPQQYQEGVVGNERRQAMEQVKQTLNWTEGELAILPFCEYTSQFHEMHFGSQDCTHFCSSTPSFWL